MAFHLGRQGVDSRHGSDGCANTSTKNIQFFRVPRRHIERVNRGIVETRKHVRRNPTQKQLRASRVVELRYSVESANYISCQQLHFDWTAK